MDFTALNIEKDQEIIVSTFEAKFYAKFKKFSLNGNRLDVVDVKNEDGKFISAFKNFPKKNVTEIVFKNHQNSSEIPPPCTIFHLNQPQLSIITNSIENFTLLQQPDAKYFEALEDISKRFVIGISADCCRGRIDNLTLLAVSTGDKIYIFDLLQLDVEKTIGELKKILEGDSQLKILYDARNIVENFRFKLKVELQPVFDVMLAAAQFFDRESVIGLEKTVKSVLGVDVKAGEVETFAVHPMPQECLRWFANQTAYLIAIYHKLASKDFTDAFARRALNFSYKDFFTGLGLTDSEKLHQLSMQTTQVSEVDFSIYED